MTFITSKDSIESLMGPAIRTQASSPSITVSPRQQRLRASGRSASQPDLSLNSPPIKTLSDPRSSAALYSSRRRSELPYTHTHMQYTIQQHGATLNVANLHSQPKRRRLKQPRFHSSVDLSLTPVIEADFSPSEEKQAIFNFSRPRRTSHEDGSAGLALTISTTPDEAVIPPPAVETSLPHNESNNVCNQPATLHKGEALDLSTSPLSHMHVQGLVSSTNPYDASDALGCELANLSLVLRPIMSGSVSSPELTCSSSMSSDGDGTDRSSISSMSSGEEDHDMTYALDADTPVNPELPLHSANVASKRYNKELAKVYSQTRQISGSRSEDKCNRILGSGSPKPSPVLPHDFNHNESVQTDFERKQVAGHSNKQSKSKSSKLAGLLRTGSLKSWARS